MDETRRWFFEVRADETIKNLIKHEFDSLRVADRSAACSEILRRIPTTKTVGVGGSVTLREIGIIDKLQEQGNVIYDHWKQGLSEEDSLRIRKMQQSSDVFLTSANAVTLSGEIVSIDGFGNRISSMMFGPKEVMIVAGYNKIVRDIPEAMNRIKTLAAGLEGIEKKYPLRDPVERNVYEMTEKERKKYKIDSLPGNLYEAILLTEKSDLVKRALGDHVFHQFIENKKIEWERYRAQVTDYELNEYFSIL